MYVFSSLLLNQNPRPHNPKSDFSSPAIIIILHIKLRKIIQMLRPCNIQSSRDHQYDWNQEPEFPGDLKWGMRENAGTLISNLIPTQVQLNQLFKSTGLRPISKAFITHNVATKVEEAKFRNHRSIWEYRVNFCCPTLFISKSINRRLNSDWDFTRLKAPKSAT